MKNARLFFAVFTGLYLLGIAAGAGGVYAAPGPSDELLLAQGKNDLLEQQDLFAADDKLAQIMQKPNSPMYQKACFWRAATVISANPMLKAQLRELGFLGEKGDGDASEEILVYDEKGYSKISSTNVEPIIIDNSDIATGYSEIGDSWQAYTSKEKGEYGKDMRLHQAGGGESIAIWAPDIKTAGEYEIFVWIPGFRTNKTIRLGEVKYKVYYDIGVAELKIKQSNIYNVDRWLSLGRYKLTPGLPARVELSDEASAGTMVISDAVKFEYNGMYFSEDEPDAQLRGNWQEVPGAGAIGGTYRKIEAGSAGLCLWRPNILSAGKYRVSMYSLLPSGQAKNAPFAVYTVSAQGRPPIVVRVNQEHRCDPSVDLGVFEFQAGTGNTITLEQSTAGTIYTDGIRVTALRALPDSNQVQKTVANLTSEIDLALEYLDDIQPDFQEYANLHTVDRSGLPVWTEFDYSDCLALKAMLNLLKVQFSQVAAYDSGGFDLWELAESPALHRQMVSYENFLNLYPRVGNLTPEGATLLKAAKDAFINALENYLNAYEKIRAETDDQGNDLLTLDSKSLTEEDREKLEKGLVEIKKLLANLRGNSPYYLMNSYSFDPKATVKGSTYINIPIDYRQYFDNPPQLRFCRPRLDGNNQLIRNSTPDPTFGGFLPGMDQPHLDGLFGLGSKLRQPVPIWEGEKVSIALAWDKDKYPDFVGYKIFRSADENVQESSFKVYESSNKEITLFTDIHLDSRVPVYYYRLYSYYRDGTKIAGPLRRVVTMRYVHAQAREGGDGSRQQPFRSISSAVQKAGVGVKICVAQGTYRESDMGLTFFDWDHNGIVLAGGYEPVTWKRNPAVYPSIIDGSGLKAWDSVIKIHYLQDVTIDGFVIHGTQDYGIHLFVVKKAKIKNCQIKQMRRDAIKIESWEANLSIDIENCLLLQNKGDGVKVDSYNKAVTINNCRISDNENGVSLNNGSVSNSVISNNRQYGIVGSMLSITNNLIQGNLIAGIYGGSDDKSIISNNTIVGSQKGIAWEDRWFDASPAVPRVEDNIIAFNEQGIVYTNPQGNTQKRPAIDFNDLWGNSQGDYEGCSKGSHDISADPLFVKGRQGDYYLSQISAGQGVNSPCLDAGSTPSAVRGLSYYTTNTSYVGDTGMVDLGYHYPAPVPKIIAQPQEGRSPLGVQFYGGRSEGEIILYFWNFGDGTTAKIANPGHTFINNSHSSKTYTVTLTVVDKNGISASAATEIKVRKRAMIWFNLNLD